MKLNTALLVAFVVGALVAIPSVLALPVDVEVSDLLPDPIKVETRSDGSVNTTVDSESVSGFGEQTNVEVGGPSGASVRAAGVGTLSSVPPAAKAASAAVGTAVGVAVLVGLWSYFKYGALAGIGGPLFSRIASHKILDNDVRNRVHECITTTPGVTIKEITQLLGVGWGTAVYHLARLEQERLIVSERHRQFRRYYKNGGGIVNDDKTAFSELKNPMTQRLAAEIASHPGAMQKELCATVGISPSLAHKHLNRLEEAHLLTKQREWKTVKYFPTTKLVEMLVPSVASGNLAMPIPA
jgi:DNA-binding MarR family transcriptional regulator